MFPRFPKPWSPCLWSFPLLVYISFYLLLRLFKPILYAEKYCVILQSEQKSFALVLETDWATKGLQVIDQGILLVNT